MPGKNEKQPTPPPADLSETEAENVVGGYYFTTSSPKTSGESELQQRIDAAAAAMGTSDAGTNALSSFAATLKK